MEIMKVSDWIDDVEIGIDNDDLFRFNGKGDDAHEDLFFQRTPNSEFCKTDRKPYDIAVRVFLGLAKYKLKRNLELSTDDSDNRIFYKAFKKYSKLKKA